jgi:L-rhamnonate dehydratase
MSGGSSRIARVEWGVLEGTRPRPLGKNARLPEHGAVVRVPLCRITTNDGAQGTGPSWLSEDLARQAVGQPVEVLFSLEAGTGEAWMGLDYPLWDLAGVRAGSPVYLLAGDGAATPGPEPPTVACYDTSLYFDDLLPGAAGAAGAAGARGADIVAAEAAAGYAAGHRAFKVKVGRGARWMSPTAGLDADVAVTKAVREAIGPDCVLLADANNGFTLNGAKEFLDRTADLGLGWLEEPFHEDEVLLEALRAWADRGGLRVELADGETATLDEGRRLAARGLIDVVQADILAASFSRWRLAGASLDAMGAGSAPHHFGLYLGNYVSGHLATAIKGLRYVEWDEARVPGLGAPGYRFAEGCLTLASTPGFGIELDEQAFRGAVRAGGFDIRPNAGRADLQKVRRCRTHRSLMDAYASALRDSHPPRVALARHDGRRPSRAQLVPTGRVQSCEKGQLGAF